MRSTDVINYHDSLLHKKSTIIKKNLVPMGVHFRWFYGKAYI